MKINTEDENVEFWRNAHKIDTDELKKTVVYNHKLFKECLGRKNYEIDELKKKIKKLQKGLNDR